MKRIYPYIVSGLVALAACNEQEFDVMHEDICLSAGVQAISYMDANSRSEGDGNETDENAQEAAPYRGDRPSENPFTADIWLSTSFDSYLHQPETEGANPTCLPIHTTILYDKDTPVFPNPYNGLPIKYPSDNNAKVYCVGFYPSGGEDAWTYSDDNKVTREIDGCSDLMFAPQISGTRTQPLQTQTYHHLQTWLKFNIMAVSEDAVKSWGAIEYIKVVSKDKVILDLGQTDINAAVSYSADTKEILAVKDCGLHTYIEEQGSVFCSPESACTLKIKTANIVAEKEVIIPIRDLGGNALSDISDIRGKLYVILLYFKPFSVVDGVCTLNAWENQDEDLYPDL